MATQDRIKTNALTIKQVRECIKEVKSGTFVSLSYRYTGESNQDPSTEGRAFVVDSSTKLKFDLPLFSHPTSVRIFDRTSIVLKDGKTFEGPEENSLSISIPSSADNDEISEEVNKLIKRRLASLDAQSDALPDGIRTRR